MAKTSRTYTALSLLSPETAHGLALWGLSHGLGPGFKRPEESCLRTTICGLEFPTPVGLAAGFDKNAQATDALQGLGVGFIEIGAVTPLPQAGNPKPRLFRLAEDRAIINRLGFNNAGMVAVGENLRKRHVGAGIVGVNIGANAQSEDRMADYEAVLRHLWGLADFYTVNVSSPNTKQLRDLQQGDALSQLLTRLLTVRDELTAENGASAPILVKIAPDLEPEALAAIAEVITSCGIDGAIATNTTLARPESLKGQQAQEKGGLSGQPLFQPSTEILRQLYQHTKGHIPLIGVGGVASAEDAYAKIRAGASLVQLYTAFIYQGPRIFVDIAEGLVKLLERDGFKQVSEAVGVDAPLS